MQVITEADHVVLVPDGPINGFTAEAFQLALTGAIDSGARAIVVDMSGCDQVTSVGLRAFMVAAKRLRAENGTIAVCHLTPFVQEVFDIAGFSSFLPAFDSREAALDAVRG